MTPEERIKELKGKCPHKTVRRTMNGDVICIGCNKPIGSQKKEGKSSGEELLDQIPFW